MENETKESAWEREEETNYEDFKGIPYERTPSTHSYRCDGCGMNCSGMVPSRKCEKGCEICCCCDKDVREYDDDGNRLSCCQLVDSDILITEKNCPGCEWKIKDKERRTRQDKKRKYLDNLRTELSEIIEKTPKLKRYIELIQTENFTEEEINSVDLE